MKMNNELIKVTVKNDQQLVSARDLYKGLGIKRRFSAWWEQNSDGFEENHDLKKIIEDAKQYRWLDTTGRSAGFVQSIFIDKKEASEVAKVLHGVVREVVGG